jgi:hypothetical protein
MNRLPFAARACFALAVLAIAAACAATSCAATSNHSGFGGGGGQAAGPTTSASGGGSTTSGGGMTIFNEGGPGGGSMACVGCSADLHDVVDCSQPPKVLMTCPADSACGPGGTCIAPCASASANQSSIGCDYYAIPADGWSNIPLNAQNIALFGASDGSCFAAFVTNNWGTPMKVQIEWKGASMDATPFSYLPVGSGQSLTYQQVPATGIPAGQMAIVFLAQFGPQSGMFKTLCPVGVQAAIQTEDVGQHGTGIGAAVHLTTSVPAVVYDIYPYGGAKSYIASATLLLPTSAWDTNYVAVAAWPGYAVPGTCAAVPMDVDVVAMTDGTMVTMLPTADIVAGGAVPASAASVPATFMLDSGQLLHLTQVADLSGSPIQANHPVGVWGENYCSQMPDTNANACDAQHVQIPPVKALGSEYVAVRYRTRTPPEEEAVPWRVMGMVAGTLLTYDPPQTGAPTSLSVGELVEFSASGPFVVTSQDAHHPFYMSGHMTGGSLATDISGDGDPETVNIVPPAQFLPSYIFFTDPTYGETDLVLVRGPQNGVYEDVTLDCLGGPVTGWTQIGGSTYQFTRVDVQHQQMPVGACDNGLHSMKSSAPFGLTVWGFDQYVSYAYPAGASVRPINTVIVPPVPQ